MKTLKVSKDDVMKNLEWMSNTGYQPEQKIEGLIPTSFLPEDVSISNMYDGYDEWLKSTNYEDNEESYHEYCEFIRSYYKSEMLDEIETEVGLIKIEYI